ncbi:MAG: hypothetical protein M3P85_11135 [Actinomycetota bacterium]|nr:hypothetical protein [Actinomycetota bacterium]
MTARALLNVVDFLVRSSGDEDAAQRLDRFAEPVRTAAEERERRMALVRSFGGEVVGA